MEEAWSWHLQDTASRLIFHLAQIPLWCWQASARQARKDRVRLAFENRCICSETRCELVSSQQKCLVGCETTHNVKPASLTEERITLLLLPAAGLPVADALGGQ